MGGSTRGGAFVALVCSEHENRDAGGSKDRCWPGGEQVCRVDAAQTSGLIVPRYGVVAVEIQVAIRQHFATLIWNNAGHGIVADTDIVKCG